MSADPSVGATGGTLLVTALLLPVAAMLVGFVGHARITRWAVLVAIALGAVVQAALIHTIWSTGHAVTCVLAGWKPPLGLMLRADGLSALMMAVTLVVIAAAAWAAPTELLPARDGRETRTSLSFWILLPGVWTAMNAVFLGSDLFNLYVALELATFSAVPLVCLSGRKETVRAALRYLLFALLGSIFYLLGAALMYGAYGTLDLALLSQRIEPGLPIWLAIALMTSGLAAKTALFPLHLWLPPAHAGAPATCSALLSSLVVKASFFITVRIWFDLLGGGHGTQAAQLLGGLGAGAIFLGGVMALRQDGLKMLVAYSTIAQIGYLFLMFPMADSGAALSGGILQAASHALAKASLFLAAGFLIEAYGHDSLQRLRGVGTTLPITVGAICLACLSLLGVPPGGGFLAKWMLMSAAVETGQWWWIAVILAGGILAGGYVLRILGPCLSEADASMVRPVSRLRQCIVLTLAVLSVGLGLFPQRPLELLRGGRPLHAVAETANPLPAPISR